MANEKILEELHNLLASEFLTQIRDGSIVQDNRGGEVTVERVSPQASLLNAARQFLKDNNIDTNVSRLTENSPMTKLAERLEEDEFYEPGIPDFKQ